MIKNKLTLTQFLRSLKVNEPQIWYCPSHLAQPEMKKFTALCIKNPGIKITQEKALLVTDRQIPQTVIIITRKE